MTRRRFKGFLPVVLFFVLLNGFFVSGKNMLDRWNTSQDVLIIGNALLFAVTCISFFLARRGLQQTNPHAFVRFVYGSIMIKLFVCMIAAFIYISIYNKNINKPALFTCMALYLVYTFMEVGVLMKMLREKNNA
ncbi:MAG: hypothetical protein ACJ75F_01470 [Flavisolibacter sp.]|jgi:ACR3 family arsenite efflux pump ArsB